MLELVKAYPELCVGVLSTFFGYFIGLVVSYSKFAQDLAYIRGQLEGLTKLHDDLKDMQRRFDTMEDLGSDYRARLKILETHVFNREARN